MDAVVLFWVCNLVRFCTRSFADMSQKLSNEPLVRQGGCNFKRDDRRGIVQEKFPGLHRCCKLEIEKSSKNIWRAQLVHMNLQPFLSGQILFAREKLPYTIRMWIFLHLTYDVRSVHLRQLCQPPRSAYTLWFPICCVPTSLRTMIYN